MKVIIESYLPNATDVENLDMLNSGGEGIIYRLEPHKALGKIYHEDKLNRQRQEKVLDLCSRYETFQGVLNAADFAFPEKVARDDQNTVVGFAMCELPDSYRLDEIFWKSDGFQEVQGHKLDLTSAIELVYQLYEALYQVHKARIVIGDLNPSNILYNFNTRKASFIDMDSVQIGQFPCAVFTPPYLDPDVEERGVNVEGCYKYSEESDNFAMAIIASELLTGGDPYTFRTEPTMDSAQRRKNRISIIGYLEDRDYATKSGQQLKDVKVNNNRMARFTELRQKDPLLYNYLKDVLLYGERDSLLRRLPKTDKRHPEYAVRKGIRTIADAKPGKTIDLSGVKTSEEMESQKKIIEDILNKRTSTVRLTAMNTDDPIGFKMLLNIYGLGSLLVGSR